MFGTEHCTLGKGMQIVFPFLCDWLNYISSNHCILGVHGCPTPSCSGYRFCWIGKTENWWPLIHLMTH